MNLTFYHKNYQNSILKENSKKLYYIAQNPSEKINDIDYIGNTFRIMMSLGFSSIFIASGVLTLLGICGIIRFQKERYLNMLFTSLLVTGIIPAALMFFKPEILLPSSSDLIELKEENAKLLKIIEEYDEREKLRSTIETQESKIKEQTTQITVLRNQVIKLKQESIEQGKIGKTFLGKLSRLNNYAKSLPNETFIPSYNAEDITRKGYCKIILELLETINYIQNSNIVQEDCHKAGEELKKYQKTKGKNTNKYDPRYTFEYLLKDFANN